MITIIIITTTIIISLEQSKKAIKITLTFGSQNVEQLASSGDSDITDSNVNIEQLLPKKLQVSFIIIILINITNII